MRYAKFLCICFCFIFLFSCFASTQRTILDPNLRLRDYNKIKINLITSTGSTSSNATTVLGTASGQIMEGEKQGLLALESLKFELMRIGFSLVSNESEADAVVELSIGNIRYDPVSGWIADQGFVKFRNTRIDQVLAFYRADSRLGTVALDRIISSLCDAIRGDY